MTTFGTEQTNLNNLIILFKKCTLVSKNVKISIYKTIIFSCGPVWVRNLEHRLRVLKNRVWRRISGPKRDEVIRSWRKLHNEELHEIYPSPSTTRMTESWRM
jgi:hypothetical protein